MTSQEVFRALNRGQLQKFLQQNHDWIEYNYEEKRAEKHEEDGRVIAGGGVDRLLFAIDVDIRLESSCISKSKHRFEQAFSVYEIRGANFHNHSHDYSGIIGELEVE